MEVAIREEQKMGKGENRWVQPLGEESENDAVEVGQVPWQGGHKNDRDENEGSCEKFLVENEQVTRIKRGISNKLGEI